MKKKSPLKRAIICPSCGHEQMEYVEAQATACRACGKYIPINPLKKGKKKSHSPRFHTQHLEARCFQCNQAVTMPSDVPSWQCPSCGARIDLTTHTIEATHSSNIFTYGGIIIGPQGRFAGGRAEASWIRIAGSADGVLTGRQTVTVQGRVQLRANVSGGMLEVKAGTELEAKQPLEFQTAFIQGKVKARRMKITKELHIGATGSLEVNALEFASLCVEPGGVFRGEGVSMETEPKT
ncbi:MAG: hypothetical protein V1746_07475 [bacterium]